MRRVRNGVTSSEYALTTTKSSLLLTAELDTTDSEGAFGSVGRAEGADDIPCDSNDNDDASKDCGVWLGSGSGSAIDSASCGTSSRGDIDI